MKKRLQIIIILYNIFYALNYFADAQVRFEIPCPFPCASDFAINTNKRKTLANFGNVLNSAILI